MKFYEHTSLKKLLGLLAVLVGLIALVTPFTPGASLLIFVGLQILGIHIVFLDKIKKMLGIDKITKKL